jgi:Arc/MetJ-type ribon-helix-helix transcriptional regulator
MKNLRITTRLEETDRAKIEQLLNEGKFKNLSQVIRAALAEFLKTA